MLTHRAFAASLLLSIAGCSSEEEPPQLSFGALCRADADCASGMCDKARGKCTKTCAARSDCGLDAGCAKTANGLRCVFEPCGRNIGEWIVDSTGNVCDGFVKTACELAGFCGCNSCDGGYCDANECHPKKKPNEPCDGYWECLAGSCTDGRVCSVPLGEPCTDQNCDVCRKVGMTTSCSRGCEVQGDEQGNCPSGFWCGTVWTDPYSNLCVPHCTSATVCPAGTECLQASNGSSSTCAQPRL